MTFSVIPCYFDDWITYQVAYRLTNSGQDLSVYRERVQEKMFAWVLMLFAIPFLDLDTPPWTQDRAKALASTAQGFRSQAHADGHF